MNVLLTLAGPIDHQLRPQFLREVSAELEAKLQAGEIGEGAVDRVARTVQRRIFRSSSAWRKQVPPRVKTNLQEENNAALHGALGD